MLSPAVGPLGVDRVLTRWHCGRSKPGASPMIDRIMVRAAVAKLVLLLACAAAVVGGA